MYLTETEDHYLMAIPVILKVFGKDDVFLVPIDFLQHVNISFLLLLQAFYRYAGGALCIFYNFRLIWIILDFVIGTKCLGT